MTIRPPRNEQSRHRERAELLGYELSAAEHGSVARWKPSDFMTNSLGRVHGGLVGSVVDDVAAFGLRVIDPTIMGSATVSMHIDYLRPLVVGDEYTCTGEALRIGGRLAVADVRIAEADGVLAVRASVTFAITRAD